MIKVNDELCVIWNKLPTNSFFIVKFGLDSPNYWVGVKINEINITWIQQFDYKGVECRIKKPTDVDWFDPSDYLKKNNCSCGDFYKLLGYDYKCGGKNEKV